MGQPAAQGAVTGRSAQDRCADADPYRKQHTGETSQATCDLCVQLTCLMYTPTHSYLLVRTRTCVCVCVLCVFVFVFVAYRAYIGGTSAPQGSIKELKHRNMFVCHTGR